MVYRVNAGTRGGPVQFGSQVRPTDTQALESWIKAGLGEERFNRLKLRISVWGDTVKLVSGHIGSTKKRLDPVILDELTKAWHDIADLKDDSGKSLGEQLQNGKARITVNGQSYKLVHCLP